MRVVFRCVARRVRRRGARHEHHGVGSRSAGRSTSHTTYESAAAHASRTSSGSHLSAPYGRRDSGVGGTGSHARPSAAFECYPANAHELVAACQSLQPALGLGLFAAR